MVRIVSGVQPQEQDTGAVMRGYKNARAVRQENEAEQRRQMEAMFKIQQTKMKLDSERAKALEEANKRAQMGDVQALRQQEMERAIANLPPDKQRGLEYARIRSGLTDPDALKLLDSSYQDFEGQVKEHEQKQAFESELQRAIKDGLIGSNDAVGYQQRAQSGEPVQNLTQEFGTMRLERATAQANIDENTEFIAQIDAAIQAMPPGRGKKLAMIAANEYKASPSLLEKEGSGAKVLATIQKAGVGSVSEFQAAEQAKKDQQQARLSPDAPAPGLGGMTTGQRTEEMEKEPNFLGLGGPKIPPLDPGFGTRSTTKNAPKGKKPALPTAKLKKAKSEDDVVAALQEAGIPLTAANLTAAEEAWLGRGE